MSGKRLVFLRGLGRESAHWDDFPAGCARALPGVGMRLVDLPGSGRHWNRPSPSTVAEMAEFARDEAGTATGATLIVAVSLGAMVAVEWMARHPPEIAGAVLVNTSLRGLNPLPQRLRPGAWPRLLRILGQTDVGRRERSILELTSFTGAARPELIARRIEAHRRHPFAPGNLVRQLWAAARYQAPRAKPQPPLLLLNSRGDRMVDPRCSETLARRWHAPLATHPWAGHDLSLDDPGWVIERMLEWLKETGVLGELAPDFRQANLEMQ